MRPLRALVVLIPLAMLVSASPALSHSPIDPEDGEGLGTATHVDDPAKSWAIYGHLDGSGDTWYFKMDLEAGERLYLSLLSTEEDFVPHMVVMGQGWERPANVTIDVDVPDGYGWVLVEGEPAEAEFEPFTPGSYHHVAKYDQEVDGEGTYYVAVHSGEGGGPFSLAVGYQETFTAGEWLSLPVSLIGIYRWEGQGWGVILGPALVVLIAGMAFLLWQTRRQGRERTLFQWTSAIAGLFILAWAAMVLTQVAMALGKSGWSNGALVTLGFVLGSLLMGVYALGPALKGPQVPDAGRRVAMLLVAGLAFFLYTGLYVGPILAIVSALLPASLAAMVPGSGSREGGPE